MQFGFALRETGRRVRPRVTSTHGQRFRVVRPRLTCASISAVAASATFAPGLVGPNIRTAANAPSINNKKSPAQVALRWLIENKRVLPIPGAKNGKQAAENAGALSFSLTPEEIEMLNQATMAWRT